MVEYNKVYLGAFLWKNLKQTKMKELYKKNLMEYVVDNNIDNKFIQYLNCGIKDFRFELLTTNELKDVISVTCVSPNSKHLSTHSLIYKKTETIKAPTVKKDIITIILFSTLIHGLLLMFQYFTLTKSMFFQFIPMVLYIYFIYTIIGVIIVPISMNVFSDRYKDKHYTIIDKEKTISELIEIIFILKNKTN